MRVKIQLYLLIFSSFVFLIWCSNSTISVSNDDWIEAESNQVLPQGMHYRIDMSTGKVLYKPMNSNELKSENIHYPTILDDDRESPDLLQEEGPSSTSPKKTKITMMEKPDILSPNMQDLLLNAKIKDSSSTSDKTASDALIDENFRKSVSTIDNDVKHSSMSKEEAAEKMKELEQYMDFVFPKEYSESFFSKKILESLKNTTQPIYSEMDDETSQKVVFLLSQLPDILQQYDNAISFNNMEGFSLLVDMLQAQIHQSHSIQSDVCVSTMHAFKAALSNHAELKLKLLGRKSSNLMDLLFENLIQYQRIHDPSSEIPTTHTSMDYIDYQVSEDCAYQTLRVLVVYIKNCPSCVISFIQKYRETIDYLLSSNNLQIDDKFLDLILSLLDNILEQRKNAFDQPDIQFKEQISYMLNLVGELLKNHGTCQRLIDQFEPENTTHWMACLKSKKARSLLTVLRILTEMKYSSCNESNFSTKNAKSMKDFFTNFPIPDYMDTEDEKMLQILFA